MKSKRAILPKPRTARKRRLNRPPFVFGLDPERSPRSRGPAGSTPSLKIAFNNAFCRAGKPAPRPLPSTRAILAPGSPNQRLAQSAPREPPLDFVSPICERANKPAPKATNFAMRPPANFLFFPTSDQPAPDDPPSKGRPPKRPLRLNYRNRKPLPFPDI